MPIHMQAVAARMRGDASTARALYEQSIEVNESLGEGRMTAAELHNLAYVELHDGNLERARLLYREARSRSLSSGYDMLFPYLLADAAVLAVDDGQAARAATLLAAAEAAFDAAGQIPDPDDATEHQLLRSHLRRALSDDEYASANEAGRRLSVERALKLTE
jgi:hypothetical protein